MTKKSFIYFVTIIFLLAVNLFIMVRQIAYAIPLLKSLLAIVATVEQLQLFIIVIYSKKAFSKRVAKAIKFNLIRPRICAIAIDIAVSLLVWVVAWVLAGFCLSSVRAMDVALTASISSLILRDSLWINGSIGKKLFRIVLTPIEYHKNLYWCSFWKSILRNTPIGMFTYAVLVESSKDIPSIPIVGFIGVMSLVIIIYEVFHLKKYGVRLCDSMLDLKIYRK